MVVIQIKHLVDSCDTNAQGNTIKRAILKHLSSDDTVSLDFFGVTNVTSSFVNSSLVDLLPDFDFATLKTRVKIQRVNRQIGNMIKDRMISETRLGT